MSRASAHRRYRAAGDSGVIVSFDDLPMASATLRARQLAGRITADTAVLGAGVRDIIPGLNNVCIQYDARYTSSDKIRKIIDGLLPDLDADAAIVGQHWQIPVSYGGAHGPDLDEVAKATGLDPDEVIRRHAAATLSVAIMGFMPGLGYLKGVDETLYLPRKQSPRAVVPARSLGIAMDQSVIYPMESPGGWNLIGRVPVRPFDASRDDPILFRPGDTVGFTPVDPATFADLDARAARGEAIITPVKPAAGKNS